MYHSIDFSVPGTNPPNWRNTWTHWHLISSSKPQIPIFGVSTNLIEAPGIPGWIDLTEATFEDDPRQSSSCTGKFEFIVDNDHENFMTIKTEMLSYLHGRYLLMRLVDDDPDWVYNGRFGVGEWKTGPNNSKVSITYSLIPLAIYVGSNN